MRKDYRQCKTGCYKNNISPKRTEFIKNLGNLVLKHNYFEFNGQLFLQQQGTTMGTRMAPNYAIIFMHKIETELLQKSPLQPTFFKIFIDDIFLNLATWRRRIT